MLAREMVSQRLSEQHVRESTLSRAMMSSCSGQRSGQQKEMGYPPYQQWPSVWQTDYKGVRNHDFNHAT